MEKKLILVYVFFFYSINLFSQEVTLDEVKNYIGKQDTIKVCGKIYSTRFLKDTKGKPTLLNIGGYFPNQKLTVVIFEESLKNFPPSPEVYFSNTNVCITGNVISYNNKPEVVVRYGTQMMVQALNEANVNVTANKKSASEEGSLTSQADFKKMIDSAPLKKNDIDTNAESANKIRTVNNAKHGIILKADTKLRSGPSIYFPIVFVAAVGNKVSVLYSNNGWSKVEVSINSNGQTHVGYVNNEALK